jgi:hypothetical protein
MNVGVVVIITVAVLLVGFLMLPRLRSLGSSARTTVERRIGDERRRRRIRVPMERRRRRRRAEDAARDFVERLS